MQIPVQLFSILRECLPPDATRGKATITLPEGTTIEGLIIHLGIDRHLGYPAEDVIAKAGWQVLVAGKYEGNLHRILQDGEQVLILPHVSGGL